MRPTESYLFPFTVSFSLVTECVSLTVALFFKKKTSASRLIASDCFGRKEPIGRQPQKASKVRVILVALSKCHPSHLRLRLTVSQQASMRVLPRRSSTLSAWAVTGYITVKWERFYCVQKHGSVKKKNNHLHRFADLMGSVVLLQETDTAQSKACGVPCLHPVTLAWSAYQPFFFLNHSAVVAMVVVSYVPGGKLALPTPHSKVFTNAELPECLLDLSV